MSGKIISMAWTTPAIRNQSKTVTRRFWNDDYARRFKAGDICQAYAKSPRNGGKKICDIRLTRDAYKEDLREMTEEHFIREGGIQFWTDREEYIKSMIAQAGGESVVWVIEFEYLTGDDT